VVHQPYTFRGDGSQTHDGGYAEGGGVKPFRFVEPSFPMGDKVIPLLQQINHLEASLSLGQPDDWYVLMYCNPNNSDKTSALKFMELDLWSFKDFRRTELRRQKQDYEKRRKRKLLKEMNHRIFLSSPIDFP